jgi:hypothetical protein
LRSTELDFDGWDYTIIPTILTAAYRTNRRLSMNFAWLSAPVLGLILALGLMGCANMNSAEQRMVSGAAIGGVLAGPIGAGVGAGIGYAVDRNEDRR